MTPPPTFVGAGLWWLAQGATLVRLRRHGKEPAGKTWQTTTSPDELRRWHIERDTSYGVLCGVPLIADPGLKLVGFDHDAYKADADPLDLPAELTVRTARGGTHRYYLAPVDLRLAANGVRGLDLRGGDGRGYLVGPASQIRLDGELRYYRVDGEMPLGVIPAEVIDRFAAPDLTGAGFPAPERTVGADGGHSLPEPLPAAVEQAFQRRTDDRSADLYNLVSTAV